ncbi:Bax inhibitor-1/YccA family protein [Candidatus Proelusimicrobium volucris]|uniref:Bax inhibitor-1/YccA family protein n=1 Tax=Candidatus Proelusimicrobium volucris TaxID=3416225 RepID=UPI003D0B5565
MFQTLFLKTSVILAGSLFMAYIGSRISSGIFQRALQTGNPEKIKTTMWTALIVNIIAFLLLVFFKSNLLLSFVFMFAFTLSSGFTLGIYTLTNPEAVQKATAITALTTLVTGLIASYSGIDFSWLGKILFFALLAVIVISVIGLFVKMKSGLNRIISAAAVLIFTGYLLFDFNNLAKLKNVAEANNWSTALDFAVNIYLDIINLLINLISLLSGSSNN